MSQAQGNRLAVSTPSDREIVMTREFDAPRELVFRAHSSCEHVRKWWGRGHPMDCEMDFRPGGAYRYVEHVPGGGDHAFYGEYLEIVEPERIVLTQEYAGMPGHPATQTIEFVEHDGKTTLTMSAVFDSAELRDAVLQSGMETGANQSMDCLADLVSSWR